MSLESTFTFPPDEAFAGKVTQPRQKHNFWARSRNLLLFSIFSKLSIFQKYFDTIFILGFLGKPSEQEKLIFWSRFPNFYAPDFSVI